jgi:hypothetical protein
MIGRALPPTALAAFPTATTGAFAVEGAHDTGRTFAAPVVHLPPAAHNARPNLCQDTAGVAADVACEHAAAKAYRATAEELFAHVADWSGALFVASFVTVPVE